MAWIWSSTRAAYAPAPAASVSPHDLRIPTQRCDEEFNLIEVCSVKGGLWRAVCECGEGPGLFPHEPLAWQWITDHRCPVIG